MTEDQRGLSFNQEKDRFRNEDEIELMDFFRVIWGHKILIILGTLACSLVGIILSFTLPKIYQVEMIIQPGVISASIKGRMVYADKIENLKTLIQKDVLRKNIKKSMRTANVNKNKISYKFNVLNPKRSDILSITYETTKPSQGVQVLKALFMVLTDYYADLKQKFEIEYETDIQKLKGKILALDSEENTAQKNINNLTQLKLQIDKELNWLNQKKPQSDKGYAYLQLKNEFNNQKIEITKETGLAELELVRVREEKKAMMEEMKYLENIRDNIQMVTLIKPPIAPASPIKPNIKLNIALFTAVGLILMLFISFFLEYLKNYRIKANQITN